MLNVFFVYVNVYVEKILILSVNNYNQVLNPGLSKYLGIHKDYTL